MARLFYCIDAWYVIWYEAGDYRIENIIAYRGAL